MDRDAVSKDKISNESGVIQEIHDDLAKSLERTPISLKTEIEANVDPAENENYKYRRHEGLSQAQSLGLADQVSREDMGQKLASVTYQSDRAYSQFMLKAENMLNLAQQKSPDGNINTEALTKIQTELLNETKKLAKVAQAQTITGHSVQQQSLARISDQSEAASGSNLADFRKVAIENDLRRMQGSDHVLRKEKPFLLDMNESNVHPRIAEANRQYQLDASDSNLSEEDRANSKKRLDSFTGAASFARMQAEWDDPDRRANILSAERARKYKEYARDSDTHKRDLNATEGSLPRIQAEYYKQYGPKLDSRINSDYLNDAQRFKVSPEDVAAAKAAASSIQAGEKGMKGAREVNAAASALGGISTEAGVAASEMDSLRNSIGKLGTEVGGANENVDKMGRPAYGYGGGRKPPGVDGHGGGGGGGADGPMTFSKLTYTSMDNIIGSLSYPLMEQALLQPMMAGMMSSEVMPGFVPNLSGAEGVFDTMSGYLPRMGEDVKELEMRQKSLKAITGDYAASDKMIQHAVEIAKAEPIQFGTAVQAFTSFSAFPGTREQVKGSQGFRESLTDVIQRLAILVPEQGEQGASFALREILSGQYRSLKQRFNMDLPQLTKAAGETGMSRRHFEGLDGAEKIDILQRGLQVMTGETALTERSLTTSVQMEDIGDTLMQELSLRFVQPSGATPMGMSEAEEERMRGVFMDQNRRTMGSRLTEQQLWEKTDIQIETAQRSPTGKMAVGLQGMVDVVGTSLADMGLGESIERAVTENITTPFFNVTTGNKDMESGGNRLLEAIDTLAKGVRKTAKELTDNPEMTGLMRGGIDAMVGTMTSTMIPGLGYGMSAGAAASWEAIMKPSTLNTVMGGFLSTATSDTKPISESLSVMAPMAMTLATMGTHGARKYGEMDSKKIQQYEANQRNLKNLSAEEQIARGTTKPTKKEKLKYMSAKAGQFSPEATLKGILSVSAIGSGITGLLNEEGSMWDKATSVGMLGAGLAGVGTSLGPDVSIGSLFPEWGKWRDKSSTGKAAFAEGGLMRTRGGYGMVGLAGLGAATVGMSYWDRSTRQKEIDRQTQNFETQFGSLHGGDSTDEDRRLYEKLTASRANYREQGNSHWGLAATALGAAAMFTPLGLPVAMGMMAVGGTLGSAYDTMQAGDSKEEYQKLEREAIAKVTYRERDRRIQKATDIESLATTGDTSRFARDIKETYDIDSVDFIGSNYESMIKAESHRRKAEQGVDIGDSEGWRKRFQLGTELGPEAIMKAAEERGEKGVDAVVATERLKSFEDKFNTMTADKSVQNILKSPVNSEILSDLMDSAYTPGGKLNFRDNKEYDAKVETIREYAKAKGVSLSPASIERFVKSIDEASDALGTLKGTSKESAAYQVTKELEQTSKDIEKARRQENVSAELELQDKDASYWLTGGKPPPSLYAKSKGSIEDETNLEQKLRTTWTNEKFRNMDATEKTQLLHKMGSSLTENKEAYIGNLGWTAQQSNRGGYNPGFTPDFQKKFDQMIFRSTVDTYAAMGDPAAKNMQKSRHGVELLTQAEMKKDTLDPARVDQLMGLSIATGARGSFDMRDRRAHEGGINAALPNDESIMDNVSGKSKKPMFYTISPQQIAERDAMMQGLSSAPTGEVLNAATGSGSGVAIQSASRALTKVALPVPMVLRPQDQIDDMGTMVKLSKDETERRALLNQINKQPSGRFIDADTPTARTHTGEFTSIRLHSEDEGDGKVSKVNSPEMFHKGFKGVKGFERSMIEGDALLRSMGVGDVSMKGLALANVDSRRVVLDDIQKRVLGKGGSEEENDRRAYAFSQVVGISDMASGQILAHRGGAINDITTANSQYGGRAGGELTIDGKNISPYHIAAHTDGNEETRMESMGIAGAEKLYREEQAQLTDNEKQAQKIKFHQQSMKMAGVADPYAEVGTKGGAYQVPGEMMGSDDEYIRLGLEASVPTDVDGLAAQIKAKGKVATTLERIRYEEKSLVHEGVKWGMEEAPPEFREQFGDTEEQQRANLTKYAMDYYAAPKVPDKWNNGSERAEAVRYMIEQSNEVNNKGLEIAKEFGRNSPEFRAHVAEQRGDGTPRFTRRDYTRNDYPEFAKKLEIGNEETTRKETIKRYRAELPEGASAEVGFITDGVAPVPEGKIVPSTLLDAFPKEEKLQSSVAGQFLEGLHAKLGLPSLQKGSDVQIPYRLAPVAPEMEPPKTPKTPPKAATDGGVSPAEIPTATVPSGKRVYADALGNAHELKKGQTGTSKVTLADGTVVDSKVPKEGTGKIVTADGRELDYTPPPKPGTGSVTVDGKKYDFRDEDFKPAPDERLGFHERVQRAVDDYELPEEFKKSEKGSALIKQITEDSTKILDGGDHYTQQQRVQALDALEYYNPEEYDTRRNAGLKKIREHGFKMMGMDTPPGDMNEATFDQLKSNAAEMIQKYGMGGEEEMASVKGRKEYTDLGYDVQSYAVMGVHKTDEDGGKYIDWMSMNEKGGITQHGSELDMNEVLRPFDPQQPQQPGDIQTAKQQIAEKTAADAEKPKTGLDLLQETLGGGEDGKTGEELIEKQGQVVDKFNEIVEAATKMTNAMYAVNGGLNNLSGTDNSRGTS